MRERFGSPCGKKMNDKEKAKDEKHHLLICPGMSTTSWKSDSGEKMAKKCSLTNRSNHYHIEAMGNGAVGLKSHTRLSSPKCQVMSPAWAMSLILCLLWHGRAVRPKDWGEENIKASESGRHEERIIYSSLSTPGSRGPQRAEKFKNIKSERDRLYMNHTNGNCWCVSLCEMFHSYCNCCLAVFLCFIVEIVNWAHPFFIVWKLQ